MPTVKLGVTLCLLVLLQLLFITTTKADIPVHCVHDDIANNEWKLFITPSIYSVPNRNSKIAFRKQFVPLNCTRFDKEDLTISRVLRVYLEYPNIVRDSLDNSRIGTWTMVYDQGFEITLKDDFSEISLFAFSSFERMKNDTQLIKSKCHETFVGNYRKTSRDGKNSLGCYYAEKTKPSANDVKISLPVNTLLYKYFDPKNNGKGLNVNKKDSDDDFESESDLDLRILRTIKPSNTKFKNDKTLIDWINTQSDDLGWSAQAYPQFEEMTEADLINLSGGWKSLFLGHWNKWRPIGLDDAESFESTSDNFAIANQELLNQVEKLPKNFDWSNVDGENYVPDVKNQMACGSCYAFAAVTAIESRIRIQSRNNVREPLAVQDIVSCSPYAQKCHGGIPYAVGRHLRDFNLVPESCFPYKGSENVACSSKCKNPEYIVKVTKYRYVSDYYGGSNYANMMKEIYEHGPISASYLIYPDFKVGYLNII